MVREYDHPVLGSLKTVSQPIRFNGDRTPVRAHAPMLGEHTEQVLSDLGLDEEEIQALAARDVIRAWRATSAA